MGISLHVEGQVSMPSPNKCLACCEAHLQHSQMRTVTVGNVNTLHMLKGAVCLFSTQPTLLLQVLAVA